jgi:hypothetical protein
MSAYAKLRKGWVLPSSLPEHGCSERERIRCPAASWENSGEHAVSASIAVCRPQAKYCDGQSDGKICALRHEVIVFQMRANPNLGVRHCLTTVGSAYQLSPFTENHAIDSSPLH